MATRPDLERLVRLLEERLTGRLEAVVFFGSQAREEAGPESDWDLLVLVRDLPQSPLARYRWFWKSVPELQSEPLDVLLRTPEEWYAHVSPLTLDIALDGRVLYDATGRMQRFLQAVRQRIEELNLTRLREGRNTYVWTWRKAPPPDWARMLNEVRS